MRMNDRRKLVIPIAVLIGALTGGAALIASRPELESVESRRSDVIVRVLGSAPQNVQMMVHSQGTVAPRTESGCTDRGAISDCPLPIIPHCDDGARATDDTVNLNIFLLDLSSPGRCRVRALGIGFVLGWVVLRIPGGMELSRDRADLRRHTQLCDRAVGKTSDQKGVRLL